MELVHVCLRNDRKGGLAAGGLAVALVAAAALTWVVVLSTDYVKVSAKIAELDLDQDPMTARVHVLIENLRDEPLIVESFSMAVWADPEQTIMFTSAETHGVVVEPHQSTYVIIPVQIRNADAFTGKVWVDVDASWAFGEQHRAESIDGKEISVGAALASLS